MSNAPTARELRSRLDLADSTVSTANRVCAPLAGEGRDVRFDVLVKAIAAQADAIQLIGRIVAEMENNR